jgi:multisubunit Na+/H+ antiporter MnhC subunit
LLLLKTVMYTAQAIIAMHIISDTVNVFLFMVATLRQHVYFLLSFVFH